MRVRSVENRVKNVIYLLPCGGIVPCGVRIFVPHAAPEAKWGCVGTGLQYSFPGLVPRTLRGSSVGLPGRPSSVV